MAEVTLLVRRKRQANNKTSKQQKDKEAKNQANFMLLLMWNAENQDTEPALSKLLLQKALCALVKFLTLPKSPPLAAFTCKANISLHGWFCFLASCARLWLHDCSFFLGWAAPATANLGLQLPQSLSQAASEPSRAVPYLV